MVDHCESPRITVVMPAYNPGSYLREAVESVIVQTFADWELIVVDDGSSEDLSYVEKMDPRIRRIRQENAGVSAARNTGIEASRGEFIAYLDADDQWMPSKLDAQLQMFDAEPTVGLCHTAIKVVDEEGMEVGEGVVRPAETYLDLLRWGCPVCTSTVMVRRQVLATTGAFNPRKRAAEDFDLWLRIAEKYPLRWIPEALARYRVHGANTSGNPALMAQEVSELLERHRLMAVRRGDHAVAQAAEQSRRQARLGWGCKAYDRCRMNFRRRNWRRCWSDLCTAARLAPGYTLRTSLRWPRTRLTAIRGDAS